MSERISHDEATEILRRFENSHFNKPGEKARASIPADLDRDDDLRMQRYIDEQRALTDALCAAGLLTEEGELRSGRVRTVVVHPFNPRAYTLDSAFVFDRAPLAEQTRKDQP